MPTFYPPTLLCDFYKISHREQYPEGTEKIYSTWTPRTSRIEGITEVVSFGFQAFVNEYLVDYFKRHFFDRSVDEVRLEYERVIQFTLGVPEPDSSHLAALHALGYLPLRIKALPEGTLCPIRTPMLTIENTVPEFFWLTNYLETLMSLSLWKASTSATLAREYRRILDLYADLTGGQKGAVQFQAHDFSMRGMDRVEAAALSGAGHLLSFVGTDSIPAIIFLEKNYGADISKELVGTSIPATEHSVMCAYGQDEMASYRRLITEVYPNGFVSIVSDTWDLWKVITEVIAGLKKEILSREGRVVLRPDSGDPVDIICGDAAPDNPYAKKGVIELLWEIFGGTTNAKGFKELDPHIGAIYGDAITLERCRAICERLAAKGFASTNVVFGVGSYTYQYNTRDTFGFALKSTYASIDGKARFLYKDPVTDKGSVKKSQTGMVVVRKDKTFEDGLFEADREILHSEDILQDIFVDGKVLNIQTLSQIRDRVAGK